MAQSIIKGERAVVPDDPEKHPTVPLEVANAALGLGRTLGYRLARSGQYPAPVIHAGARYRVPTAALRRMLGLDP